MSNNKYLQARSELGYSREAAVKDLLDYKISVDRLFRIENGKLPAPDEVCTMAEGYRMPELRNYYCNHECEIGKHADLPNVGRIERNKLPQLVLELLSSLNSVEKDTLIEISADGEIDTMELQDFVTIREQLEKISEVVEGLKLWADKHIGK